jgi:hypothetical protein
LANDSKVVAVICKEYQVGITFAREYIKSKKQVVWKVISHDGIIITEDGFRYILITNKNQAMGYEFYDVIVSPCYIDLVGECRARIR